MTTNGHMNARTLHSRLNHPVVDADGHWIEYMPVMREQFRRIGGEAAVEALDTATSRVPSALKMSVSERARKRVGMEAFWSSPSENVLDRATAMFPRLMYERLDDLGIDFSVVYPTAGLSFHRMQDDRLRRAICRAYNVYTAEQFRGLSDRIIPAAIIPMYTPEEALEELEFVVKQLGYKVVMVGGMMRRRVPALEAEQPEASKLVEWYDVVGLDSPYDYDPVWAKCLELKVAPSFHNGARSILLRNSPSNFCYNHIGHFASAGHAVAKAMFFGGVTRRFPQLNFAFLEGGVGWACMLYADLIGHWEKRGGQAMRRLDPDRVDWDEFAELFARYGGEWASMTPAPTSYPEQDLALLDEFAACGIERAEDIRDLFAVPFYCGCEADDPMSVTAFATKANPFGARFNAMFGSDISHWDVPVMADVLGEVYEMVEHDLFSEADLRDFVFTNPVRFYTRGNPQFFAGTTVEAAVAAELQG